MTNFGALLISGDEWSINWMKVAVKYAQNTNKIGCVT
jgi:hypothetical protein